MEQANEIALERVEKETRCKMTDTKRLRELASKATPGPWEFKATEHTGGIRYVFAPNEAKDHRGCEFIVADVNRTFNASFIAAANPEAVLALIARIERLESFVSNLKRDCKTIAGLKMVLDAATVLQNIEALKEET
jgi:uncharacterized protein (UPF0335 family)